MELLIRGGWENGEIPKRQFCGICEACYGLQNDPMAEMIFAIGATVILDGKKIRMGDGNDVKVDFVGGFISHVEMNTEDFLKYAGCLFSQHPVTSVRLLDKHPVVEERTMKDQRARWWNQYSFSFYDLPRVIFDFLLPDFDCTRVEDYEDGRGYREYHKEEHAVNGCSKACVRFGRNLVGLPLEW